MRIKKRKPISSPEEWSFETSGVSSSFIAAWLQCREKSRLGYQEKLKRILKGSSALRFGEFFHRCLEIGDGRRPRLTVDKVQQEWMQGSEALRSGDALHQAMEEIAGKAEALLVHYHRYWQDVKKKWITKEEYFRVKYHNAILVGIVDGVIEDSNGGLWLVETKTASRVDINVKSEALAMDLQTQLYLVAMAQVMGKHKHRIRGVIYNIIRKPQLKQRKKPTKTKPVEELHEYLERIEQDIASRPEHYFNRIENACGVEDALRWGDQVLKPILEEIERWAKGNAAHYKNPAACQDKFGLCTFFPICARNERSMFRTKSRPYEHHPQAKN